MNFNRGFEISFVGIIDISSYTKSEQPRVAGNHLRIHTKDSMTMMMIAPKSYT